ncbi:substrate-binding domain-containing protein, partial [Acinetobacter baumannii]
MQAKEEGVLVVMYSADLPVEYRELRDIFVGVDDTIAGQQAAAAVIEHFPDGAKVIEVGGTAGTDAQIRRHDGFNAGLEGSNIEVL